ncbi:TRAP transporter substrate-binding protein [Siminovitchia sp. FSL W7-1587]|uniref:TRAP transporter substrate-binding protein n=1 Tax=Siminovitchia sp. FSL W7-1587 TaxID=2954699 RepID=UPI0030CABC50
MRKKLIFMLLLSSIILVFLAGCGQYSASNTSNDKKGEKGSNQSSSVSKATYQFKLGHQAPENSNYQKFSQLFKEKLEKKTGGNASVSIYPFRQLGADRELLEAMQLQTLDFGVISGPPVSQFAPQVSLVDLPFLFNDWEHVNQFVFSDAGKEFMGLTEDANLKMLGVMNRGFRHVTNNKGPIETIEDFQGLSIRVIESDFYTASYKALEANPQQMNWGDAYTGLEQGAIDAQENTLDIIHDEKVDEVQKYVSKTGIHFVFAYLMASKPILDNLPDKIQQAVMEAAAEAGQEISKENEANDEKYEEILKEKGMEINNFDRSQFDGRFDEVYELYTKKYGDDLLKKIQSIE